MESEKIVKRTWPLESQALFIHNLYNTVLHRFGNYHSNTPLSVNFLHSLVSPYTILLLSMHLCEKFLQIGISSQSWASFLGYGHHSHFN